MTSDISRADIPLARAAAEAQATLREAAAAATATAARARSLAALLDEALAVLTDLETAPAPTPAFPFGTASLSPREREVLALVAVGRSNKAIAEALFVSPNTIKTHVASLLQKLQADSRVELAAMATQHSLHQFAALSA